MPRAHDGIPYAMKQIAVRFGVYHVSVIRHAGVGHPLREGLAQELRTVVVCGTRQLPALVHNKKRCARAYDTVLAKVQIGIGECQAPPRLLDLYSRFDPIAHLC